jgi:hypothetical protein
MSKVTECIESCNRLSSKLQILLETEHRVAVYPLIESLQLITVALWSLEEWLPEAVGAEPPQEIEQFVGDPIPELEGLGPLQPRNVYQAVPTSMHQPLWTHSTPPPELVSQIPLPGSLGVRKFGHEVLPSPELPERRSFWHPPTPQPLTI